MATKKKDVSTTEDGEDDVADVSKSELADVDAKRASGNRSRKGKTAAEDDAYAFKGVQDPTEHPDWTSFRTDVENTAAGDLNQDPREPYPTGNPPDPEQVYAQINGFLPGQGGPGGIAGARDTPNPRANEGRHGWQRPDAKEA